MDVRDILIPGRSMALAGQGMDGKSIMLIELTAAALNRCGAEAQPRVLVIASQRLVRCFKAEFGDGADEIEFIDPEALKCLAGTEEPDSETAFSLLERIARLHRPNLIVLQHIAPLINQERATRQSFELAMRRLSELATRVHTSLLTIEPEMAPDSENVEATDRSNPRECIAGSHSAHLLGIRLAKWLSRGELPEREIMRRTATEGFSLFDLQSARAILGIRSYVRLSEGARHRVWRLRDS
jgi:hypothetical protein